MQAEMYWICEVGAGRLGIMPRPRGGDWLEDEIRSLRDAGVDVVISLLEPHEVAELEIAEEPAFCKRCGWHQTHRPIDIEDGGIVDFRGRIILLCCSIVVPSITLKLKVRRRSYFEGGRKCWDEESTSLIEE